MISTTGIQIIHATTTHLTKLVGMWQAIDAFPDMERPFGGDHQNKPEQARQLLEHAINSSDAIVLLARNQKQILGTISGHVFDKPAVNLNRVGVIYGLWVEAAYRRQGIAQYLLSTLEKELKHGGAQAFQVGWDCGNEVAAQWWQHRGYMPYEVIASKVAE